MSGDRQRMSLIATVIPTAMALRRANYHYRTREHVRRHIDELLVRPRPVRPPRRVRSSLQVTGRIRNGWRIHTVEPRDRTAKGTVIYLHGGAWIHEAVRTHWKLVQQVADEASVTVLMPVYPLVHEGGIATAVVPQVADLAAESPGPVALMGDSAGGTIALSASLMLKDRGTPVALTSLISPAIDLRMVNPEIEKVQATDPWLVKKGQLEVAEMWLGDLTEDPIYNPIFADLAGFGRMQIFSGTRDILNPDTRVFVDRARAAGVDLDYHEHPGHVHESAILPTPEGKEARGQIVEAVRQMTGQGRPIAGSGDAST